VLKLIVGMIATSAEIISTRVRSFCRRLARSSHERPSPLLTGKRVLGRQALSARLDALISWAIESQALHEMTEIDKAFGVGEARLGQVVRDQKDVQDEPIDVEWMLPSRVGTVRSPGCSA